MKYRQHPGAMPSLTTLLALVTLCGMSPAESPKPEGMASWPNTPEGKSLSDHAIVVAEFYRGP